MLHSRERARCVLLSLYLVKSDSAVDSGFSSSELVSEIIGVQLITSEKERSAKIWVRSGKAGCEVNAAADKLRQHDLARNRSSPPPTVPILYLPPDQDQFSLKMNCEKKRAVYS